MARMLATRVDRGDRAERWFGSLWDTLLRVTLIALGAYFLWRVRSILATVIVSAVIAYAASALVEPLCRRRVRGWSARTQRVVATSLVFLFLGLTAFWSVQLLVRPFQIQYTELRQNWPTYRVGITKHLERARAWYGDLPADLRKLLEEPRERDALPSPSEWMARVFHTSVTWASHVVELILLPVLAFYFTLDARILRNEFLVLVPRARVRDTLLILREGSAIMRAYIIAQFWLAVIAGVAVGVGLWLIGMPYALILGIFAGITRAIPVIGPLLGGIPIVLLAFVYGAQINNELLWVWVLVFFTLLHLIESKVIMPKFLGHHLNLHAAVIIIVLLIGGEFFGLMGMFLAAPLAALARVLVHHYIVRPRRRQQRKLLLSSDVESPGGGVLRLNGENVSP